jgi:hypothetical protein
MQYYKSVGLSLQIIEKKTDYRRLSSPLYNTLNILTELYINLLIYVLLNDAVSGSDYKTTNGRIIHVLRGMWNEAVVAYFEVSGARFERGSKEHKAGVPLIATRRSA